MEDLKKFIKKLIEESKKENIITNLQKINKRFLTGYQIQIKDLTIISIDTEIYYWNNGNQKNFFVDKMIYKNKLQEAHFSKLYFHRIKYKEDM